MRKSRLTEEQIVGVLQEQAEGVAVRDLCQRHGISAQTFYRWRRRYRGLTVGQLRQLKALEEENARLKRVMAQQALDNKILTDLLSKIY